MPDNLSYDRACELTSITTHSAPFSYALTNNLYMVNISGVVLLREI